MNEAKQGIEYGVTVRRSRNMRQSIYFVGEAAYISFLITTTWWLKQHTFIIPQFLWVRSLGIIQPRHWLRVLYKASMQVWTRLHSFLESRTSSNTLGCWKNSLPSNCRIEVPVFYCQLGFLAPRGSQFLVVWLGPRPSLTKWQFTLFFFFLSLQKNLLLQNFC